MIKSSKRYYCESGSRIIPHYHPEIDKSSGLITLVKDEKGENIYKEIQSHLLSTDLRNLFERSVKTEDRLILKQVNGIDFDVDMTELPSNLMEAQNSLLAVKTQFESLPVEVKKDFENNFNVFLKRGGKFSDDYIDLHTPKKEEVKKEEVKKEEVKKEE